MVPNTTHIDAAPEDVWAILADPPSYAHFVVGSQHIHGYDPEWPAKGATFHHSVGIGPLSLRDSSTVIDSLPPRMLMLSVRFRPFGEARVEFRLSHSGTGTEVVMEEELVGGLWNVPGGRGVAHAAIILRNKETLRRLRHLAETRAKESRQARLVAERTVG